MARPQLLSPRLQGHSPKSDAAPGLKSGAAPAVPRRKQQSAS